MKRTFLLLMLVVVVTTVSAQVPPPSVRLQGYLTDRTVNPAVAANGTFSMDFSLWDQLSGGQFIQQEVVPAVTVVDGLYDVSIPFGPALFDAPRWLQIAVDGEILMPRLPFDSSPYSFLAGRAVLAESVATDGVDNAAIQAEAVSLDKLALDCSFGEVIVRGAGGWQCLDLSGCLPNVEQSCYSGPQGTLGLGPCAAGTEICQPDGQFGPCAGEVLPMAEICQNGVDDDCNGVIDDAAGAQTFYRDQDGDGYGDPNDSMMLCAPVPPYTTTNSGDCYDQNANARPGQTQYFGSHRGDGSFDFNCDSVAEQQYTAIYACTAFCDTFNDGYMNSVPPCGVTATFGNGCDSGFVGECDPDFFNGLTQTCR
jgi:hypothetical protein